MALRYVIIAAFFLCVSVVIAQENEDPAFCKGNQCPRFAVVNSTNDDYEIRDYESSVWVSTVVEGRWYDSTTSEGFYRLFYYISGNNTDGSKIEMTSPVTKKVVDTSIGPLRKITFTVSFFVPFDLQDNPPQPTDDQVFFTTLPAQRAYVRSFGGFASGLDYRINARRLAQDLNRDGETYDDSYYYTAGYDGPYTPTNRRNEVWFIAN